MHDAFSQPLKVPAELDRELTDAEWLVADTLLRRGFPLRVETKGITLLAGAIGDETRERRALLRLLPGQRERDAPVELLGIWMQDELIAEVDTADTKRLESIRTRSLGRDSIGSMTGPPVLGNLFDWWGFKITPGNITFPVVWLEEGIALLVKVLPEIGVMTSMSCHGHPARAGRCSVPKIWFYGPYHSRWCERIFDHLFDDLPISRRWKFDHGPSDGNWMSATWDASDAPVESKRERQFLFDQIQAMARRLIDPQLTKRIRRIKSKASSMEDLFDRLDQDLG